MAKDKKKNTDPDLHSAAQAMGRKGGSIGGPARDRALSHEEKSKIARLGGQAKAAKHHSESKKKQRKGKGKG